MLTATVTLLAHQGGWDEILMVLTPIAVFALLLTLANRRANQMQARARAHAESGPATPTAPAPAPSVEDDRPPDPA